MTAWFNENDPGAAQWLRNLTAADAIARGVVDDRSIREVSPNDLAYDQCHFFAGVGVWSRALRDAGWPDDRPVWTGSCPCQPFSDAGRGGGVDDERHLWPVWFDLISERRPPVVFGEQVASRAGLGWLDVVRADLEGAGYAFWAHDICAAGLGAPHVRQRLFFVGVADTTGVGQQGLHAQLLEREPRPGRAQARGRGEDDGVGDPDGVRGAGHGGAPPRAQGGGAGARHSDRRERDVAVDTGGPRDVAHADGERRAGRRRQSSGANAERPRGGPERQGDAGDVADAYGDGLRAPWERGGDEQHRGRGAAELVADPDRARRAEGERDADGPPPWLRGPRGVADADGGGRGEHEGDVPPWLLEPDDARGGEASGGRPPAVGTRGFWADCEWVPCRDGKARPVEPGTFPLVDGNPERVGPTGAVDEQKRTTKLKGYGNAIVRPAAVAFIRAVMEVIDG